MYLKTNLYEKVSCPSSTSRGSQPPGRLVAMSGTLGHSLRGSPASQEAGVLPVTQPPRQWRRGGAAQLRETLGGGSTVSSCTAWVWQVPMDLVLPLGPQHRALPRLQPGGLCTAVSVCWRPGGLQTADAYCSQVGGLGGLVSRCQQRQCPVRAHFLLPAEFSHGTGARGLSGGPNLTHAGSNFLTPSPPKDPDS